MQNSEEPTSSPRLDPGSFRDRDARVVERNGRLFRVLSRDAERAWRTLVDSGLLKRLVAEGRVVPTHEASLVDVGGGVPGPWTAAVEHERVPFVSYPYEWSFGMLKAAALAQLDVLEAALACGMTLIDASAYNSQWRGATPVFIDIPSLRPQVAGQPWLGYRQFCQLFLYPLMLQAYRDVAFHPWLRGSIDGITPHDMNQLRSLRDLLRPGVFLHVFLHSKLQAGTATTQRNVRVELKDAGFSGEMVRANVRGMRKLVERLSWKRSNSEWSSYTTTRSYTDLDVAAKRQFVEDAAGTKRWRLVWDLGCNTGELALIAAPHADYVVAMDSDHLAVEMLYRHLTRAAHPNILPLVNNLADPSTGLGWRGHERRALVDRGRPDLVLAMALIHHIVLGANIPLAEFVAWLAGTTERALLIEFVTRDDPMVQRLLLNKEDKFSDYDPALFEQCLAEAFTIERKLPLASGTRVLYFASKTFRY